MVLRKLRNHLLDKSGSTVFGAEVYIYARGTDTLATLYADDAGAVPLANPLITSSLGLWECYLETGRYRRVSIVDSAIMEVDDFELVADLEIGADVQAWDADLDAVAALTGTGIAVRTATATWTVRAIAGTASQITVTNGDGVAGAPTLSLPASITLGAITERVADAGVVIEGVTLKDGGAAFGGSVTLAAGASLTMGTGSTLAAQALTATTIVATDTVTVSAGSGTTLRGLVQTDGAHFIALRRNYTNTTTTERIEYVGFAGHRWYAWDIGTGTPTKELADLTASALALAASVNLTMGTGSTLAAQAVTATNIQIPNSSATGNDAFATFGVLTGSGEVGLQFGRATTGTLPSIQAILSGTGVTELRLNPAGGDVSFGGSIKLGIAYAAGAPTPTGYLTFKDNTGTLYQVPAVAV